MAETIQKKQTKKEVKENARNFYKKVAEEKKQASRKRHTGLVRTKKPNVNEHRGHSSS